MIDLYAAMTAMVCLAIGLMIATARLARRWQKKWRLLAMLLVLGLMVADLRLWRDSLWPAPIAPLANLIVWANLTPLLGALLIGLAWGTLPGSAGRRCVLIVPMALLCLWSAHGFAFATSPQVSDHWKDGVCRQTTSATCSPAAAATILRLYGLQTKEAEMSRLCLTTIDGTSMRGLYRGLILTTRQKGLVVSPLSCTIDDLPRHTPAVLSVGLQTGAKADPRFTSKWGWAPGVTHSVVLIRVLPDGRYDIGDPSVGRETWDRLAIETLWRGEGIEVRALP